jgi:hypothetical protein
MPETTIYTHAEWRVIPGRESEFVRAWRQLARAFASLAARPLWGTLLQSTENPSLFYSFGPWASEADVLAMRADPEALEAIGRVTALCEQARPGAYRLVAHVTLRDGD